MMAKAIVNKKYQLQKFPGKGGWTYAEVPEILQNKSNPFGWVKVKGSIDNYKFDQVKLMPMGNGKLFLPVKAAIRKKIKKQAGDFVHIKLYPDLAQFVIPEEIMTCLKNENSQILEAFKSLSEGAKKQYIDWIYGAKKETTKIERILKMITQLQTN